MQRKTTPAVVTAPGVIPNRPISTTADWAGKHRDAEQAIRNHIPGLHAVSITEGTRGRPVDSIFILVNPDSQSKSKKKLTRKIEGLLKTLFGLIVDYRVISIQ